MKTRSMENAWAQRALFLLLAAMLLLCLMPSAYAAELPEVCYPTSITQSEDSTELKKLYDLTPEADPAGIPRSSFEQDGLHYTLTDLLKQELPEHESRQHTETVSLESAKKDMESVLALLPQEREFITEDGLIGTLTLRLDTVQVEPSGYTSSTKEISATRSYPNLSNQDTQYIPKSIEDNGKTLTLSGTATSSYVKGYTVTADYTGTVSRIALNRVRYVAIFEGTPIVPVQTDDAVAMPFNWLYMGVPICAVAVIGAGIGIALFVKRRKETTMVCEGDET